MPRKPIAVLIVSSLAVLWALAGCRTEAPPASPTGVPVPTSQSEPTLTPTTIADNVIDNEGILISEFLPGVPGNNNLEFIELYNTGLRPVDLQGWSLWYQLDDNQNAQLVKAWESRTDVPGLGHYLLGRAGHAIGTTADSSFDVPLFERKGGLALRGPGGKVIDALVWGTGPEANISGAAALVPESGASLERLPGGDAGNGTRSGDNATDFVHNPAPNPQNTGAPITPWTEERVEIQLSGPQSAHPGAELTYTVKVRNLTGSPAHDVRATIPIPADFEVISMPPGASTSGSSPNISVEWLIKEMADGEIQSGTITIQSPWTYLTDVIRGYYVETPGWTMRTYGEPLPLSIAGGSVPIAVARELEGQSVTVEGVATMYTGGFFAGSTGTKFYLEDETGGIQVYCPGGKGQVDVSVGDRVRVTGGIEAYRDSIEIVPLTYPDDVETVERRGAIPDPESISLQAARGDDGILGRLVTVEGTASRIEEFSYSYEIDLLDEHGSSLLIYIEKDTGVTVEPLQVGQDYRVTGISELFSGSRQIKPRLQSDLVETFPPELLLSASASNSILPGETLTVTLTAYNHTAEPLTNVRITAPQPAGGVSTAEVLDGGQLDGSSIVWTIPELAGNGESATVNYAVIVNENATGQISAKAARVSADEWPDPVESGPLLTFIGAGVPIWAVQGSGMESPYVRNQATTIGVVTGVFPDLDGFWIQETETDDDPATSAGLFVLTEELNIPVNARDQVRVKGKVRERAGQTTLHVETPENVTVLSSGKELPTAVELDPPQDEGAAHTYFEALEGMLVQVTEPAVAVAPTSKYGETALAKAHWDLNRVMHGDPTGMLIFVDDGSGATHYSLATLPFAIQTGDSVAQVVGPLAYTYGQYKIEPTTMPVITSTENTPARLEPPGTDEFSVATFNVEDLFDFQDPHPSDPPPPSVSEYRLDLTKMGHAILKMGAPTIVGLQEVENVGILDDLVAHELIAEYAYQPFLVDGTDSRGIDVAYMVRGDQASVEGPTSYPAPEGLTSRPPLLVTVTLHLESGDETVYVLNNHFTSMSGGEKPTEPRRTAQANWNVTLVERILDREPDAHVVVLGDLNSFYDSPPLDAVREAGLRHVYEFSEPERPYTYIFQGESETLDHILVTPSLYELLVRVEALHINADYPPPVPGDPSARRVSDHDPLVAVFSFAP